MTLIAHYRLDGNADDAFGKFNGVASNVTWAAGKLGQAASFNGSTSYIDSKIGPEIFRADVSICMWANFLDDSRGILFGNYNNVGGFAVEKHIYNRLRVWFNGSFDYFTPNNVITTDAWHHLAFVRDTRANQWRVYVDGALVGSTASAGAWVMAGMSTVWIGRDIRTGTTTTYGSLDDVRIYDHALSVREVRDLALGLAVHYPMLDFQEPTENLYPMPVVEGRYFTSAYDGQYDYGVNTNSQWVVDNSDQPVAGVSVQKVSRIESGVSQILYLDWGSFYPAKSLAPGQSATISFWYYGTYGTSIMPYIGGGTGGVVFAGSGGGRQVIAVPVRQWHRVSFTLTNPTLKTKTYGYGWMRLHYNTENVALSNQEFWKFTAVQTELKPYPTEYTKGVRSARVVDTSGQGADAPLALTTTPKWIEESPTGRGSYLFTNDATKRIDRPLVDLGSTLTYSCWAKQDSTEGNAYKMIVSSGRDVTTHGVNVLSISGVIRVFYGGGPEGNGSLNSGVSVVGVWRHIVFTHDMANGARLYVDGVLTATGPARTINYSEANNRTVIGKMAYGYTLTNAYFPFSGPISDVRLYASALTADQVKELYQQRASLDSQGNLYAQLINEKGATKFQVTKAGQLSSQVSEVGITDGLVAYYPLTKDTLDYSGNGRHGTAVGATLAADGYYFNQASHIAADTAINTNAVQKWSVSAWVYLEDNTLNGQELCNFNLGCKLVYSGINGKALLYLNGGANDSYTYSTGPMPTGRWSHVVFTADLELLDVAIYLDGRIYGRNSNRPAATDVPAGIPTISRFGLKFKGRLRDLRVYSKALSSKEVSTLFKVTEKNGPTKMTQHQGVTYIQGEFKEV